MKTILNRSLGYSLAAIERMREKLYWIYYSPLFNHTGTERSINVLHDKKIVFIHNPKCAGTSVKQALKITIDEADHRAPGHYLSPTTWETYSTFTIVRNPFSRLVSSYAFHTSERYQGGYARRYPFLKELCLEDYFKLMKIEPYVLRPQIDYTKHCRSNKPIDFICHFENLQEELPPVFHKLGIKYDLPHLNQSSHRSYREYFNNDLFLAQVTDFYQDDLNLFGYNF